MSLRFIDELVPNGKTFPIADANNIRGGLHYAATVEEMNAIHSSRLAPGVQCYVEETDIWYEYNFELEEWVRSRMGDSLYRCTQSGVAEDEKSVKEIGVLSPTARNELETMTINEILTRAFFAEKPPYYTETRPTWTHAEVEVGTPLDADQWIVGTKGSYSYGYLNNGKVTTGVIAESLMSSSRTLAAAHQYALFGTQTNACSIMTSYQPAIKDLGTSLLSSWNRTRAEYNAEHPTATVAVPAVPGTAAQAYLTYCGYTGYYIGLYLASPRTDQMTTLEGDVITLATSGVISASLSNMKALNVKIKAKTTADITITELPNTAFVYVAVPNTLRISQVKMLNGLTAKYDVVPTSRFGKIPLVSPTIDFNNIPKKDGTRVMYSYAIWFIAKGDKNANGEVSPSNASLQITLSV